MFPDEQDETTEQTTDTADQAAQTDQTSENKQSAAVDKKANGKKKSAKETEGICFGGQ